MLPGAVAADAGRVARFEREATILASLDHPNIASIYGLEEARASTDSGPAAIALILTRDGSTYAFVVHGSTATAADIWTMRVGARPVMGGAVQRPGNQWSVRISPDGKWISYASDESGRFEVWVEPIAGGGLRYQVSRAGGREAVWSADGTELFYRSGDRMMVVPVTGQPGSPTGVPRVLFTGQFVSTDIPNYDVSRKGERFLMLRRVEDDIVSQALRIVDNWFEDLKRLAPAGK